METKTLEAYADMKLELYKATKEVEELKEIIHELEATRIPKEDIKAIFTVPYESNIWVDSDYRNDLINWYNGNGPWPTHKLELSND